MSQMNSMNQVQTMLAALRNAYLQDLPEVIDELEDLIYTLDKKGYSEEVCHELYRRLHSVKGSGGTHGLHAITDVCHPFEDLVSELLEQPTQLHNGFLNLALEYLDLLRQTTDAYQVNGQSNDDISAQIRALKQRSIKGLRSALVVETSEIVLHIIRDVLKHKNFNAVVVADGYSALGRIVAEQFDVLITGLEVNRLNGLALIAACQQLQGKDRHTKTILVTASQLKNDLNLPDLIIRKDSQLRETLAEALRQI